MEQVAKSYEAWIGRDAYDRNGDKIGEIESIYYDDRTSRPEWVAVRTGLFGRKLSFVPIAGSSPHGDDLQLAYEKATVKDSPNCEADGHLSEEEERRLFGHYQFNWDDSTTTGYGELSRADSGFDTRRGEADRGGNDDAMTRSEEELRVGKEGTQRTETGKARLRKYVVTEQQQVTVPVTREKVRVEREPITHANVGQALSGPEITESEHEVVTHEERPVVSKQAVPKERVRLQTEQVTDEETVTGEVRKEQIDVEGGTDAAARTQRR
jgi:uncharacterized protein (TIGR02271 family)